MVNIQAHQLKKVWKSGDGLRLPFSYHFEAGKGHQIIGTNGCGKTTLLKILCGLLVPDEGKVSTNVDIGWCGSHGCGATPRLTGIENINLMVKFLNVHHDEKRLTLWRELEGFSDALNTDFGHCSHGMQMMISLYLSQLKNLG
jgi:ABC-type polysaccharide/polyol phosphate transport system ATPase subunit